jgi:hypothetical protein
VSKEYDSEGVIKFIGTRRESGSQRSAGTEFLFTIYSNTGSQGNSDVGETAARQNIFRTRVELSGASVAPKGRLHRRTLFLALSRRVGIGVILASR